MGSFVKIFIATCFLYINLPLEMAAHKAHDIHVSLCELRWNEESAMFEVSIKIFIDDLELAFRKEGTSDLFIGTPKEAGNANDIISQYLQKHFLINMDGRLLPLIFMGKEVSEDFRAIWCYVEFSGPSSPSKKCTMTNDILLDIFEDQRNIMDIRMSKSHKDYIILQSGHSTWSYTF